jgi:ferric-dicitrate binding protein FerR (iron transport regulator)
MTAVPPGPRDDDGPLERSLESGLRRPPLTDEAYARIRSAVAAEWRATIRPRSRWALRGWGGIAASLAAATLVVMVWLRPSAEPAVLGSVAIVESGGLESRSALFLPRSLGVGAVLRAGEMLTARGSVLVKLKGGGTLRIARGTQFEAIAADEITLHEGEVYVDMPPNLPRAFAFVVRTPVGLIEHLGTQFDVAAVGHEVRIRVREGRVRLRRGSDAETAAAGTELVVPKSGPTSRHSISTHGGQWSWIEALEPEYTIEDRKLVDFLEWAARETGLELSFVDDRARNVAEQTRLHGSVRGMPPAAALEMVLKTTSLRYELEADVIRVSSGG